MTGALISGRYMYPRGPESSHTTDNHHIRHSKNFIMSPLSLHCDHSFSVLTVTLSDLKLLSNRIIMADFPHN